MKLLKKIQHHFKKLIFKSSSERQYKTPSLKRLIDLAQQDTLRLDRLIHLENNLRTRHRLPSDTVVGLLTEIERAMVIYCIYQTTPDTSMLLEASKLNTEILKAKYSLANGDKVAQKEMCEKLRGYRLKDDLDDLLKMPAII